MLFTLRTKEEIEKARKIEAETYAAWDNRFTEIMDVLVAHNRWYMEKQRGMGARGVHGHEGVCEARIPAHLLKLALMADPNFLEDDKTFYKFLNKYPEFRSYDYNRRITV